MKKIFYMFLLLAFSFMNAQQYVIGKVTTETSAEISGVTVYNVRSEEMSQTDIDGNYIIKANVGDELRFIKQRFERISHRVKPDDFSKLLNVSIQLLPQMIEEVEVAFRPTGDLKKDSKALNRAKKVEDLNNDIALSLLTAPETATPSNQMPSTIVMGPNYSAGQISLLTVGGGNGGLIGLLASGIKRKLSADKLTPDYIDRQNFYKKVKESVDLDFFYEHGLDEYQFEMLLVYADKKHDLAKNFKNNFNKITIENYLKTELKEFIDTKIKPSQKPS